MNEEEYQMPEVNKEVMNENIKNYSIKKLTNNPQIQQMKSNPKNCPKNINNRFPQNDNIKKPRVNSTRVAQRNNNNVQKFKKISNNNMMNKNQNRKNVNMQGIPKMKYLYNNGRIVKMAGGNNNYGDINMMNLTEPNNNY